MHVPPNAKMGLTLPNGTPAFLDSSGHIVNLAGRRCDGIGRETKARGAPGVAYTARRIERERIAQDRWDQDQQDWNEHMRRVERLEWQRRQDERELQRRDMLRQQRVVQESIESERQRADTERQREVAAAPPCVQPQAPPQPKASTHIVYDNSVTFPEPPSTPQQDRWFANLHGRRRD